MAQQKTFIEVCAGAGGLNSGFIEKGFQPLLINEIDKRCCATLLKNHPNYKDLIVCECMTKLDFKNLKPDVLMGGVPCQSFSYAGLKKGIDDPRGILIIKFTEMVHKLLPKAFLIENVKGLISHDNGKTLELILKELNKNNQYNIYTEVLNANDYGVAQRRERLFIVGIHKTINKQFKFPQVQLYKPVLQDVLVNVPASEVYEYPEHKKLVMQQVPQGGCWIDLPLNVQKAYMKGSFESGGGKRGMARRLAMDKPSLTLTTSPSQNQTERCHPIHTRPLTVREYARIQSFPDTYIFEGSVAQKYKQIGNAVPPKLASAVADAIKLVLI